MDGDNLHFGSQSSHGQVTVGELSTCAEETMVAPPDVSVGMAVRGAEYEGVGGRAPVRATPKAKWRGTRLLPQVSRCCNLTLELAMPLGGHRLALCGWPGPS